MIAELVHAWDDEPPYAQIEQRGARWVLSGVTCVVDGRRVDRPLESTHGSRKAAQTAALVLMRENREALAGLPLEARRLVPG